MQRFKWPAPSESYLEKLVSQGESDTLQFRVEGLKFLWEEFGPPADMLLTGGFPAMFALNELKCSYVYGNYMATVLLAQVFIEQSLGSFYSLEGKDEIARRGFAGLIDAARKDGKITAKIAETFHALRMIRNPYTHNVAGLGAGTYMGRLVENSGRAPEDLVVEDGKFAIRTLVDYLRHGSPDWNPGKFEWSEDDA